MNKPPDYIRYRVKQIELNKRYSAANKQPVNFHSREFRASEKYKARLRKLSEHELSDIASEQEQFEKFVHLYTRHNSGENLHTCKKYKPKKEKKNRGKSYDS